MTVSRRRSSWPTGRLRRWHGFVLLGLYVVYFGLSLVLFGGVPVEAS